MEEVIVDGEHMLIVGYDNNGLIHWRSKDGSRFGLTNPKRQGWNVIRYCNPKTGDSVEIPIERGYVEDYHCEFIKSFSYNMRNCD